MPRAHWPVPRADWDAARLLVRSRVAEAWWVLAAAQAQAPALAQQIDGAEQALALTRLRVLEGAAAHRSGQGRRRRCVALQLQAAQLAEQRTRQRLALGLLLADRRTPARPRCPCPPRKLPPVTTGAPANNPPTCWHAARRVQQARAQLDAALHRLRRAQAARYPQLSFSAGLGSGGPGWRDWLDHPLATLTASLVVPLVDWAWLDRSARTHWTSTNWLRWWAARHAAPRAGGGGTAAVEQQRLQQEQAAQAARLNEGAGGRARGHGALRSRCDQPARLAAGPQRAPGGRA